MAAPKRTKRSTSSRKSRRSDSKRPTLIGTKRHRTTIAKRSSAIVERDKETVQLLKQAAEYAIEAEGFTLRQAARSMYISPGILSLWLNDSIPIDVVAVRRSKRLWPHFIAHFWHIETAGGVLV